MRFLVMLSMLAACELQPAPKKGPPPAPTPPPAGDPTKEQPAAQQPPPSQPPPSQPPPSQPPAGPPTDAAIDAQPDVSQECIDVSSHIAATMIKETKDPAQLAAFEQDRAKIIRRTAEVCTRNAWKAEIRECINKAPTVEAIQVCAKDLAPS